MPIDTNFYYHGPALDAAYDDDSEMWFVPPIGWEDDTLLLPEICGRELGDE